MFSSADDDSAGPIVPAGLHLASFTRRGAGVVIDQVIITVPVFAAFYVLGYSPNEAISESRTVWFTVAITALGLAYETMAIWRWGRTLGKLVTSVATASAS